MFGFVTADAAALTKEQRLRYGSIYCGICRQIRSRSSQLARLGLSYDMAFLALLLGSLYEPQEQQHSDRCLVHPVKSRPWVEHPFIQYAADMNVMLVYYKCLDDWQDDRSRGGKWMASRLQKYVGEIREQYPRQCAAVESSLQELSELEKADCTDPDRPANCFGRLMGELLVYQEDLWADALRKTGFYLGRFIYLADAMVDYPGDIKKERYNPLRLKEKDPQLWREYLELAMGSCTEHFERLPLVQDKDLLDHILYNGVWRKLRNINQEARESG